MGNFLTHGFTSRCNRIVGEGHDRRLLHQDPVRLPVQPHPLFRVRDAPGLLHQPVRTFVAASGWSSARQSFASESIRDRGSRPRTPSQICVVAPCPACRNNSDSSIASHLESQPPGFPATEPAGTRTQIHGSFGESKVYGREATAARVASLSQELSRPFGIVRQADPRRVSRHPRWHKPARGREVSNPS